MSDPETLRRELRQSRLRIPPWEVDSASEQVCDRLLQLDALKRAKRVAAYVGRNGEIDPMPFLDLAHCLGKRCYLPVLHPFLAGRLWFAPWTPSSGMRANRFGIPEPHYRANQCLAAQFLDVILAPLLGFDRHCHRIGMGGGFYDRTLWFRRFRRHWRGPRLIGLAHQQQYCDPFETRPWDVAMDQVVTATSIYSRSPEKPIAVATAATSEQRKTGKQ